MISYGRQHIDEEDIQAVVDCLRSNALTQGPMVTQFEKAVADYVGARYAVAVSSGTAGLHIAALAAGVGPGNALLTSPITFVATSNAAVYAGGTPLFADVDADSQNITAETIAAVLTPRTRAIICVHLGGMPCDMDPIMALARQHDFKVIEDCAQAHGARYKGRSVGSIGHIAAWSFCQDKIMTTGGEGGMVTTDDEALWRAMWAFKDHGKSHAAVYDREHPPGFRWLHESFGTNWRMLEMQAVIGRIQLRRLPGWTARREDNARQMASALEPWASAHGCVRVPRLRCSGCVARLPQDCDQGCGHAWYKFYFHVVPSRLAHGWDRDKVVAALNEAGVPAYQGTCSEVYLEKAFDGTDWRPKNRLPVARQLGETSVMLLVHPTLDQVHIDKTCRALQNIMQACSLPST